MSDEKYWNLVLTLEQIALYFEQVYDQNVLKKPIKTGLM